MSQSYFPLHSTLESKIDLLTITPDISIEPMTGSYFLSSELMYSLLEKLLYPHFEETTGEEVIIPETDDNPSKFMKLSDSPTQFPPKSPEIQNDHDSDDGFEPRPDTDTPDDPNRMLNMIQRL